MRRVWPTGGCHAVHKHFIYKNVWTFWRTIYRTQLGRTDISSMKQTIVNTKVQTLLIIFRSLLFQIWLVSFRVWTTPYSVLGGEMCNATSYNLVSTVIPFTISLKWVSLIQKSASTWRRFLAAFSFKLLLVQLVRTEKVRENFIHSVHLILKNKVIY